jgi:hypothetical protein
VPSMPSRCILSGHIHDIVMPRWKIWESNGANGRKHSVRGLYGREVQPGGFQSVRNLPGRRVLPGHSNDIVMPRWKIREPNGASGRKYSVPDVSSGNASRVSGNVEPYRSHGVLSCLPCRELLLQPIWPKILPHRKVWHRQRCN